MTIELADDVAALLTERAAGQGVTPSELLAELLGPQPQFIWPPNPARTPEEFRERMKQIGSPIGAGLTDEQLRRENIYD